MDVNLIVHIRDVITDFFVEVFKINKPDLLTSSMSTMHCKREIQLMLPCGKEAKNVDSGSSHRRLERQVYKDIYGQVSRSEFDDEMRCPAKNCHASHIQCELSISIRCQKYKSKRRMQF